MNGDDDDLLHKPPSCTAFVFVSLAVFRLSTARWNEASSCATMASSSAKKEGEEGSEEEGEAEDEEGREAEGDEDEEDDSGGVVTG